MTAQLQDYCRRIGVVCKRCGIPRSYGSASFCRTCYRKQSEIKHTILNDRRARKLLKERPLWPIQDCQYVLNKIKQKIKETHEKRN